MPELNPWIALVGAVGSMLVSVAALLNAYASRQKSGGDFAKSMADAASSLVDPLTKRVSHLESTVSQLEFTIAALRRENKSLRDRLSIFEGGAFMLFNQTKSLGHTPAWTPPPPLAEEGPKPTP